MKNDYIFISASLMAHVFIILLFAWQIKSSPSFIKFGNANKQVVSSYLVNASNLPSAKARPKQHRLVKQLKNAIALSRKKNKPLTRTQKQTATAHKRAAVKGAPMPELIALLHAGIQKHQRYPASAQEMEREGRVTLMFTLFTNGSIKNVKIKKSSGTTSLDNAAIAAVNKAAPFNKVDKYIKNAQDYQIDVVFELS